MTRCLLQSLQELVDTAIQSEAPYQPQLILAPNWLTGAGDDPREVWRALKIMGRLTYQHLASPEPHLDPSKHALLAWCNTLTMWSTSKTLDMWWRHLNELQIVSD